MLKKLVKVALVAVIMAFLGLTFKAESAYGSTQKTAYPSSALKQPLNEPDNRLEKLTTFLGKHNSPLTPYADEFIEAADTYELDWRLVPAITGVESTFGKRIPYKSYNAYGWNNGAYKFTSWEDSIWHVTKTLKEKYVNRGATDVYKIGRIYAPPSKTWSKNVSFFMAKIENTQAASLDL